MKDSRIALWLGQAVGFHQAGRLADADRLYDKVLKVDRKNPDALNLKGVVAAHGGRFGDAICLYERSIASHPTFADAHYNKATALVALGREEEALQSYAQALVLNPTHANARLSTGNLLHRIGRHEAAIDAFRMMTRACPMDPRGFYNLGSCLMKVLPTDMEARVAVSGEALAALRGAQSLDPGNVDIRLALAEAYAARGEYAQAIEMLRVLLEGDWGWPAERRAELFSTLGEHLRKDQRHAESITAHRKALTLSDSHLIRFNLAAALADAGHLSEAEAQYREVIAAAPDFVKAYVNLGNLYRDMNKREDAIGLFEQALAIEPTSQAYANIAAAMTELGWLTTGLIIHEAAIMRGPLDPAARYNRALAQLSVGRFDAGWAEHEARFDIPQMGAARRATPEWQGEDLSGKRILIWTEQGIGDQILHGAMITDVIARAGHVLVECVARLAPIFTRSFPQATVIGRAHPSIPAADGQPYDYQIAAGSLGRFLRRDFASFPQHRGYLKADLDKAARLRRSYSERAKGRRIIGIAWRSKNPRIGANKTAELANLAGLLSAPGFFFVNLQYGDCAAEIADACARFGTEIFQDRSVDSLVDMDTYFAQVAAMDAVVTTSNTAVHVAGSQNIPTWLLLPHGKGALWYWFLRRADSPWYPSVRISRAQRAESDQPWESEPATQAAAEIAQWINSEHDGK